VRAVNSGSERDERDVDDSAGDGVGLSVVEGSEGDRVGEEVDASGLIDELLVGPGAVDLVNLANLVDVQGVVSGDVVDDLAESQDREVV